MTQANQTQKKSKEGRLPMNTHSLKQEFDGCTYQISIRTDGEIGNKWLSIKTLETPHEQYGWPNGGCISIPLPLVSKLKDLLTQYEAVMGEVIEQGGLA
jgi:hypothetical protein